MWSHDQRRLYRDAKIHTVNKLNINLNHTHSELKVLGNRLKLHPKEIFICIDKSVSAA